MDLFEISLVLRHLTQTVRIVLAQFFPNCIKINCQTIPGIQYVVLEYGEHIEDVHIEIGHDRLTEEVADILLNFHKINGAS